MVDVDVGVEEVLGIWGQVVSSPMSSEKERVRQEALLSLMNPILKMAEIWQTSSTVTLAPVLEFITLLGRTPSVFLSLVYYCLKKIL